MISCYRRNASVAAHDASERRLQAQLGRKRPMVPRGPARPRRPLARARAAFDQRFVDEVDPDRVLPEPERLRRAAAARKAHYQRMTLASIKARRAPGTTKRPARHGPPQSR